MSSKLNFGQLSRGRQIALVGAGLLAIALIGYLVLVSPRRSQAGDLKAQTAQVQAEITRNLSSPTPLGRVLPAVEAADIFQLTKAMPTDINMADVIIELNQLADATGLSFDQISPQALLMGMTYNVQPINLSFTGNYYNVLDFLFRVRNLVAVYGNSPDTTFRDRTLLGLRGGKLYSTGRMYSVSKVSFAEAPQKFPIVTATLTLDTFELPATTTATLATETAAVAPTQPAAPGTTTTATGSQR